MNIWGLATIDLQQFFDLPDDESYQKAYTAWGEYGWTILPSAPVRMFHTGPASQADADTIAMGYFDEITIKKLLQTVLDLSDYAGILSEAVCCYNNEMYRGCAMIVVSIFEREMFELQNKEVTPNRVIGRKAVKYTGEKMNASKKVNQYNTPKCYVCNMEAYLNGLFSKTAPNFAQIGMKDNLVRDYLMHGMHDKPITKVDCLKLFNAMENWLFIKNNFGLY